MEKTYEELTASEKTNLVSYWALDEAVESDYLIVDEVNPSYTLGSELLTNGDFDSGDTGWSKGTGCTIVDQGGGDYEGVFTNVASGQSFYQAQSLTIGKTYKLTATVTDFTDGSGAVRNFQETPANGTVMTGTGTSTLIFVCTNASPNVGFRCETNNSDFRIDDISLKEVTSDGNLGVLY